MSRDVLVVVEHLAGKVNDISFEMLAVGKALAAELGGQCNAALIGGPDEFADTLGAAERVFRVRGTAVAEFNPETHAAALGAIVEQSAPTVVVVGNTSMGTELANALAVARKWPLASSCVALKGGERVTVVANLYGGKLDVTTDLGTGPCVVTWLAGAGSAEAGQVAGAPEIVAVNAPSAAGHVRFVQMLEPEAGDVDITTQDVLVAIGRGIGSKDGVEVATDLAEALGAAVAASRPIVDAGWLPKSRQVGKSGLKVKPKVYIALGISGAPEHLEGMNSSATIIAINTDANAPIFGVAHYGMTADLFEVCEELTEALE